MNISKISNSINIPKKINVELPKIVKSKTTNTATKGLIGLSCLAALGCYLVIKPSKENKKTEKKEQKENTFISNSINTQKKINVESPKTVKKEVTNTKINILTSLSCLAALGLCLTTQLGKPEESTITKEPKDKAPKQDEPDNDDTFSPDSNFGKDEGPFYKNDINPGYDGKTEVVLVLTTDGRCVELYRLSNGKYITPSDYHFPRGRGLSELTFSIDEKSDFRYGESSIASFYSLTPMESTFGTGRDEKRYDISYKKQIMETLTSMDGYEAIIEELCKPENEELYKNIFNFDETDSTFCAIAVGNCTKVGIINHLLNKLNPSGFDKNEADNSLISRISLNLLDILEGENPFYEDTQWLYSEDSQWCNEQTNYVFI